MPGYQSLLSDAERLAEQSDLLSAWFASELGDVLLRLERALQPFVADQSKPLTVDATRLVRLRTEIRDLLESSGYDGLVAAASVKGLDALARRVLSRTVPTSLSQEVAALQQMLGLDLLDQGDVVARELWRAVARGVLSGQDVPALVQDLAEALDRSVPHIRTLYDTSVSIFTRQVEALQSTGEPDEAFLYSGPIDDVIRPFCYDHVGRVYTRAEIDQMDNGQLPNVFLTGGGYNCRHILLAVSQFSGLHDYVGGKTVIPEIASQLARVKKDRRAA